MRALCRLSALALVFLPIALAAAPLPVKDWVQFPRFRQAIISPGGEHVAVVLREKNSENYDLAVMTTDSVLSGKLKVTANIRLGQHELFGPVFWVNDKRVAAGTETYFGGFDRPFLDGNLFAIDADGGLSKVLMGVHSSGLQLGTRTSGTNKLVFFGGLLSRLSSVPNSILVEGWTRGSNIPNAYRLDTLSDNFFRVATGLFGGGMLADHNGSIRLKWGLDQENGVPEVRYRPLGSSDWKDVSSLINTSKDALVAFLVTPSGAVMFGPDNRSIYFAGWTKNAAETLGLFKVDMASGKQELLYADPTVDVGYAGPGDPFIKSFDRKSLVGLRTLPGLPDVRVFDAHAARVQLLAELNQVLPGQEFDITSWTDDGSRAIVQTWSDHQPSAFYLYSDKPKPSLSLLFRQTSSIRSWDLSPTKPISYVTRDGLTVHGYLTVPHGVKAKNLPLIIYVHGGPHGFRYGWGFDDQDPDMVATQMLADYGYAVLAPNYRGSGGYGLKFMSAGFRHWGDTMQDDLADAANWAVGQGIANPKRICILGASYGGYASLMSAERFPDLFRCAVGYSGVYDLTLQETRQAGADRYAGGRLYLDTVLGHDDKQLRAFSPAFNAQSLKAAVFLLHGGRDQIAPVKGYKEMVAAIQNTARRFRRCTMPTNPTASTSRRTARRPGPKFSRS